MLHARSGLLMVEIALVVVLVAIFALVALPNYLENRTRTNLAGARSDLRHLDLALQAYVADYQAEPRTDVPGGPSPAYSSWWGYSAHLLTTPTAYLATLPVEPFTDQINYAMWRAMDTKHNNARNQPYIYIRNTYIPWTWLPGQVCSNNPNLPKIGIPSQFHDLAGRSAWIFYSCGPDGLGGTVWATPEFYDPSNGTASFGDIIRFGEGNANDHTEEMH